jgi:hypothetical protein
VSGERIGELAEPHQVGDRSDVDRDVGEPEDLDVALARVIPSPKPAQPPS